MADKEITYVLLKKDGTRVNIKGNFIKYDAGTAMVVRVADGKNTVVGVVNMEAVVVLAEAEGFPPEPKTA